MFDKSYGICGACLEEMHLMEESSIDSIVTDPPYGLEFMGRDWDHGIPGSPFWVEALRVLKPGGYLLAFGGTRTFHRLACAIEDAGFEIRDCVMWVYGSGFPKSLDVSKAIDKAAGAEREVVGRKSIAYPDSDCWGVPNKTKVCGQGVGGGLVYGDPGKDFEKEGGFGAFITAPSTEEAKQWAGWGTALKPAWEPIIVARKPLIGTVAANVLKYGTGGINIDGCRVEGVPRSTHSDGSYFTGHTGLYENGHKEMKLDLPTGRWPANLIHDGSEEALECFPNVPGGVAGSAARFFYCAKASKKDRGEGNSHPTVKPTALMRYLCKLVTQPGGIILDPFMGSGSTGVAAHMEGFEFIGIEKEEVYVEIAKARIIKVREDLEKNEGKDV